MPTIPTPKCQTIRLMPLNKPNKDNSWVEKARKPIVNQPHSKIKSAYFQKFVELTLS